MAEDEEAPTPAEVQVWIARSRESIAAADTRTIATCQFGSTCCWRYSNLDRPP